MKNDEVAARIGYETYCKSVGGKAFNGDPLPSWEEFVNDPKKQIQSKGWIDAAAAILQRWGISNAD